jgi:hypothetical protein
MRTNIQIFAIALIIMLLGCDRVEDVSAIPEKPETIPEESIWVGGLDGGVFVSIQEASDTNRNEYSGEIYYVSGDLAYKGLFDLQPEDSGGFDQANPKVYEGWDGDTLYLSNGRQLKIREP